MLDFVINAFDLDLCFECGVLWSNDHNDISFSSKFD
jgi:hypothetical protein